MDDATEFPYVKKNSKELKKILKYENNLCKTSAIIICSSANLKQKLIQRYNINANKIKTINNGININNLSRKDAIPLKIKNLFIDNDKIKIVYIGTISEWFDFDLIIKSLNDFKSIMYLLIGPKEVDIPNKSNIKYFGPVQHEYVSSIMDLADILVMPFKKNELIKSVNPVKVYEYIYSGKPSIIIKYEETMIFKDYVFLYDSYESYCDYLRRIIERKTYIINNEKRLLFLKNSTWESRVKIIYDTIKKLM